MSAPFTIRSGMGGEFDLHFNVPSQISYHRLPGAIVHFVAGPWGHMIFQQIILEHADLWDSQYALLCPIELSGGYNMPFIEFHNSVKNHFHSQWEHVPLLNDKTHEGGLSAGPYMDNIVRFPKKASYRTTDIHFKTPFLAEYIKAYPKLEAVINQFERSAFAQIDQVFSHGHHGRTILQQLVEPNVRAGMLSHHYTNKIKEFLSVALEIMDPETIPHSFVQRSASRQLAEDVATLIHERFHEPLLLEDVARALFTTISTLQRAFKKQFGETFHQYLLKTRIDHVKKQLLDTSDDLESIAVGTQFHDAAHLIKVFKQFTKKTPLQWRSHL